MAEYNLKLLFQNYFEVWTQVLNFLDILLVMVCNCGQYLSDFILI